MHIAGPERRVNQTLDGLVCPGVPMISRDTGFQGCMRQIIPLTILCASINSVVASQTLALGYCVTFVIVCK